MSFPAYGRSKDSGWPWIGDLPSHWDVRRLKTLFSRVTRPVEDGDKIVTAFRDGQVTLRENRREEGFTNAVQEIGYQGVRRGDLVIHAMDGFAGAIGVSDSDGKSTPVYTVCVAEPDASARYYALLLRHMALSGFVTSLAKGIRERSTDFRWADASVLALPHPPLDEQVGILAFLDRETAKIDALVEAQRRLIELLKEKRQAVISQAVTRGLEPSAPIKDSGVEWLGKVPAHWEVRKFTQVIGVQEGPGIMAVDFMDEGVPLLRVAGAQGRWASLAGCNYLDPSKVAERWEHFRLNEGDLVISGSASTGTVCEVGPDTAGAVPYTGLMRITPVQDVTAKDYVRALVGSAMFFVQIDQLKAGATIQHFGPTHLSRMVATVPPLEEQGKIAAFVDAQCAKFAALVAEAEAAVLLLQERRAALISAAVTGKIDVRGLVQTAEAA